jgi:hypothetical protein
MARHDDDYAFAFPWTKENSIQLMPELEFHDLYETLHRHDLYNLYVKCQENLRHYGPHPYMHDYIVPEIKKLL